MNQVQQIIHEALIKLDRIPKEQRNPKWFNDVQKNIERSKLIAADAVNMNHPLNALLSDSQPAGQVFMQKPGDDTLHPISSLQSADVAKCICPEGAIDRSCPVHVGLA